jgi:hypothetical protein
LHETEKVRINPGRRPTFTQLGQALSANPVGSSSLSIHHLPMCAEVVGSNVRNWLCDTSNAGPNGDA